MNSNRIIKSLNIKIKDLFTSKYKLAAIILIISGIIIRLILMAVPPTPESYKEFISGTSGFDTNQIAFSIAKGKGYFSSLSEKPSGSRMYVITFIYSIYYLLSKNNIIVLKLIKISEYLAGAFLILIINKRFFIDWNKILVFILFFYCLVPHFAALQINIIETGPLIIFVLFFLYTSTLLLKTDKFRLSIVMLWSLSVTLFYFTRSDLVFCIIFFIIIYIYRSIKEKKIFLYKKYYYRITFTFNCSVFLGFSELLFFR